jgi:hypothetical protein
MRTVLKAFGAAVVVASAVMVSAGGAAGAPPSRFSYEDAGTFTDTSLCGFPVHVTYEASGVGATFGDLDTGDIRLLIHATQQDTFTANGTTLVGDPYRATRTQVIEDFEVVSDTVRGVLEKVRLPDGSIFMGAGRTDFLAATVDFIAVPDHGVAKNQDAFCAALSA